MGIEAGKIAVIFDDDPRLAAVWKGKSGETQASTASFPFSATAAGGAPGDGDPDPRTGKRPQLSDIVLKGFELYEDASGMQRARAKFRIYNSSDEEIDGFLYTLTMSDTQGGRS